MTARLTVLLPFTATTPTELHDAIDTAFAREAALAPENVDGVLLEAPDAPLLLRFREVADLLGVSLSTIEELHARSGLPVVRINTCVRVRRDELTAWLDALTAEQRKPRWNGGAS